MRRMGPRSSRRARWRARVGRSATAGSSGPATVNSDSRCLRTVVAVVAAGALDQGDQPLVRLGACPLSTSMSAASRCAARSSGSAAALASAAAGVHPGHPAVAARPGPGRTRPRWSCGDSARIFRYAASAASRSPVISASSAASSRGSSGGATADAAGLEHRVDVLPDLRLGQHAGEALDELAADHRDDHRDALHAQRLGQPRVGVDVDLAEHPAAAALGGQLLQHRGELLARLAPLGPEVEDRPAW